MPGKVKVKIVAGRNLPVMDRSSDTTDAYVEIKLGNTTYKTDVCRKSLNPQWISEWYRFEVDDAELQDEPLQIRLMDHDTYSANDAIGKVYLDLNPLLLPPPPKDCSQPPSTNVSGSTMSGWLPVYDTMHGIRGEVNVIVKVELFSDFNKFRQSSCGVQFFCSPVVPQGFHIQVMHGFVEELVVNDDPEYQWIDKIRTPRASNEARQTLFLKLSGEVQRKIGLKALDLGGNAVLGYHQCFDLERESGIVARGIGTAVTLIRLHDSSLSHTAPDHPEAVSPLLPTVPPSPRLFTAPPPSRLDDDRPILLGPRFPKPKAKKSRPTPVVVVNIPDPRRPQRQASAPGELNKMSKSIVSDLGELRNLVQQEDYRQMEVGGSRFAKAMRFIPKKVSALKSRLQSDEGDLDTMSFSSLSTKSLSMDRRKRPRAYQRCSSDSVAAALIRSIMMDAGGSGGLDRVMEKDEPSARLTSSDNDNDNDNDEDLTYNDSSIMSSSCDSSTSGDDLSDSSREPSPTTSPATSPATSSSSLLKDSSISSVRRVGRVTPKHLSGKPQHILRLKKKERSSSPLSTKSLENPRDGLNRTPSPAGSRSLEVSVLPSSKKTPSHRSQKERRASPNRHAVPVASQAQLTLPAVSIQVADEGNWAESDNLASPNLNESEIVCMSAPNRAEVMPPSGSGCNSLTLAASPCVLIPLHKSRSASGLASQAQHSDAPPPDGSASDAPPPDQDGLPSHPHPHPHLQSQPQPHAAATHKLSQSPARGSATSSGAPAGSTPGTVPSAMHRRSSDSDLSITPKGNSLTGSDRSSVTGTSHPKPNPVVGRPPPVSQDNIEMLEYPFLTMSKYPPNFIVYIGGNVSSRSVKLLQRITNLEEPETRDAWWKEIRMEVRSHARALGCNVVLGYSESTSICDEVCVLSASGTAAVINMQSNPALSEDAATSGQEQQQTPPPPTAAQNAQSALRGTTKDRAMTTSLDRSDFEKERPPARGDTATPFRTDMAKPRRLSDSGDEPTLPPCIACHVPYNEASVPFAIRLRRCAVCRRGKVPDVLFATIEPPDMPVTGRGCLMQAYVCRTKRDCKGELNAKEISDGLPFLEYELHRLLVNKLKVKGMNAIFGLKVVVSIGERMLVGLATGTAVYLTALPPPPVPTITAGNSWKDNMKLAEVQRTIQEAVKRNRELYRLKPPPESEAPANGGRNPSDTDESEDELQDLDLATGNKDTCVLEVDDNEDVDVISLLMDPAPPEGFLSVNLETVPGLEDMEAVRNLQMFTQVWRAKVVPGAPLTTFSRHFHRVLQSVFFKLRRTVPCSLCKLQFRVDLPETDELQLCLLGMAIGLGEADKTIKFRKKPVQSSSKETLRRDEGDLIFSLEEDVAEELSSGSSIVSPPPSAGLPRTRNRSPHRGRQHIAPKLRHTPPRERYGVDISPLSYIPGGKIDRYLGNVNFFLIRESTCIKESGGLSGFVHSFMAEVLAIVRAHVTALGGNAMVAYFISENVLLHNAHKNQGQCLINVGGDVVHVSYPRD